MKRLTLSLRNHLPRTLGAALLLLALLLMAGGQAAGMPGDPQDNAPTAWPGADDGILKEVGAEGAGGAQQAYADSEVHALTNRLATCNWTPRYHWSGSSAWEEDFKRTPLGGTEPSWLDTVDLGFYVGHGGPDAFTFDVWHDDPWLTPNDCYQTWGRYDNDWVALTSCSVLSGSHPNPWANCMYGQHLLLGFKTGAAVRWGTATQGYQFANHLCYGWTVTGAWFRACDLTNPAGAVVTAFAEEAPCFNDVPGGANCEFTSAFNWSSYYYLNHTCGSPMPRPLNTQQPITQMPVFQTEPLTLAEATQLSGQLGTVFGLNPPGVVAGNAPLACSQASPWVSASADGTQQLEMDCYSGQFNYTNLNMWMAPAVQQALAAGNSAPTVTPEEIAYQFLSGSQLLPGDATYAETGYDTAGAGGKTPASNIPMQTADVIAQVIYERNVSAPVVLANGLTAVQNFQVVGPGGKLIVSVPLVAGGALAESALPVAGTLGGWPKLQAPAAVDSPTGVQMTPILSEDQILKLHTPNLEGFVVMNNPPIEATEHRVISTTLGYWSEGLSQPQPELIPAYVLSVDYYTGTVKLTHGWEYIPANPTYMHPYAKITSFPQGEVQAGQTIQLGGADAALTLAALGYDPALTFGLGTGPFVYTWYVDSIAPGNEIGNGRNISWTVQTGSDKKDSFTRRIFLQVSDSGSSAQAASSDSASVTIVTKNDYLPVVVKK